MVTVIAYRYTWGQSTVSCSIGITGADSQVVVCAAPHPTVTPAFPVY